MSENKDRISKYLVDANKGIVFDELKEDYLKKAGVNDILGGIPVPLIFDDEGMSTLTLALGMARIVGGDNNFVYAKPYVEYIKRILGDTATKVLVGEGAKNAQAGDYEVACMFFRTALLIDPSSCDALYLYGRACKDAYEIEEMEEDYVGNFKAEALEIFEVLTMLHQDFAMGYYFLGYGYLNLGLYTKAKLTWDSFMELSDDSSDTFKPENISGVPENEIGDLRKEIEKRLFSLEEPVLIEKGCNMIMGGNYQGGLEVLEKYTDGRYSDWWPLWYYIGNARSAMMDPEGAIEAYKKVLVLSPSNTDVMKELADVYDALGDKVNRDKYLNKIELIKSTC